MYVMCPLAGPLRHQVAVSKKRHTSSTVFLIFELSQVWLVRFTVVWVSLFVVTDLQWRENV